MKLLLDTHTAIWALVAPERLGEQVRAEITKPGASVFVSAVSIWEIAIKRALKKAGSPPFSGSEALGHFRRSGFLLLDVTPDHAAGVDALPGLHRDPFDRLLVSQALAEPLRLVTRDAKLAAYSDTVIVY